MRITAAEFQAMQKPANTEYLGNAFLWRLRARLAHRRELSRRSKGYALAAEALRELLMRQIKLKYEADQR